MTDNFTIRGVLSQSGIQYVHVSNSQAVTALIPLAAFHGSGSDGLEQLCVKNMPIIGLKACREFIATVASLNEFEPAQVIENIGWSGQGLFALPDGSYVLSQLSMRVLSVLPVVTGKTARGGSMADWLANVATPMCGHPVLEFAVMVMFMAPLLDLTDAIDNPGFALVGPTSTGKTTTQRLMSSVAGGIGRSNTGTYFEQFDTTLNGSEDLMKCHKDMPLVLEEAEQVIASTTRKSVQETFRRFTFKFGGGSDKKRFDEPRVGSVRMCYFFSCNQSPAAVIDQETDTGEATGARLITIPIGADRPLGVIDRLPKGYESAPAFLDRLIDAAAQSYGHAFPRFLEGLVAQRTKNEDHLRRKIAKKVRKFRETVANVSDSKAQRRVAEVFGLAYAAADFAKKFGALPNGFRVMNAAKYYYHLHLQSQPRQATFVEHLAGLAASPNVVDLGQGILKPLSPGELEQDLFKRRAGSVTRLMIRATAIKQYIPDWKSISKRPDVRASMIADKDNRADEKVTISPRNRNTKAYRPRVYVFELKEEG